MQRSFIVLGLVSVLAIPPAAHAGTGGRTLGAAYARNRSAGGGTRSGATGANRQATPSTSTGAIPTGLGSSRGAARRPYVAPTETATPAVRRAPRTRAEARAIAVRESAAQAAARAAAAAGESETAFAEHANAQRTAARAEAAARGAIDSARAARTALGAARSAAARARSYVTDAEAELASAIDLRDRLAASQPRKGNPLVNFFMAPFRAITGSRTARAEWEDAVALADLDVRTAKSNLAEARSQAAPVIAAAAVAEDSALAAETAAETAGAELETTRAALGRAMSRLGATQRTAGTARALAESAEAEASAAEDKARASLDRVEAGRARVDQHRLRVAQGTKAAQDRYRAAARRVKLKGLIESKPGEVSQDAIASAPEMGLYAIADGVTHSDFSGPFARALVRSWTEAPPADKDGFDTWLSGVQATWKAETDPIIEPLRNKHYNRGKTWVGHAAFVGARLEPTARGQRLRVMGTGDTVAFLVRGGTKIEKSFPLARADQFSDVVEALPSSADAGYRYKVTERSWPVKTGDEVFLATDALAAWIFGEVEAGRDPFPTLRAIKNQRDMTTFVTEAREGRVAGHDELHLDDTALVHFTVPAHND